MLNPTNLTAPPVTVYSPPQTQLQPQGVSGKGDALPFSGVVEEFIQHVETQQQTVARDLNRLASGDSANLQAMAANVAKADLSFRFLMEMRDKLIASYQEVLRMQI